MRKLLHIFHILVIFASKSRSCFHLCRLPCMALSVQIHYFSPGQGQNSLHWFFLPVAPLFLMREGPGLAFTLFSTRMNSLSHRKPLHRGTPCTRPGCSGHPQLCPLQRLTLHPGIHYRMLTVPQPVFLDCRYFKAKKKKKKLTIKY